MLIHPAGAGQFHLVRTLLGDNMDNPGDGIAPIKGGGGPFHNFNAFDVGWGQQVQIVLSAYIPVHPLAVNQDEDGIIVQPIQLDPTAHVTILEGE